jgi:hypothetical protein
VRLSTPTCAAIVRDSADALDVRASDLRAAIERAVTVCGARGGTLDEMNGDLASY